MCIQRYCGCSIENVFAFLTKDSDMADYYNKYDNKILLFVSTGLRFVGWKPMLVRGTVCTGWTMHWRVFGKSSLVTPKPRSCQRSRPFASQRITSGLWVRSCVQEKHPTSWASSRHSAKVRISLQRNQGRVYPVPESLSCAHLELTWRVETKLRLAYLLTAPPGVKLFLFKNIVSVWKEIWALKLTYFRLIVFQTNL